MLVDDARVQTTNTGVLQCVTLTDDHAYKSTNPLFGKHAQSMVHHPQALYHCSSWSVLVHFWTSPTTALFIATQSFGMQKQINST